MMETVQQGIDVTLTCFNECLELAVQLNYHFAAGFITLREPENMIDCFVKAFLLPDKNETTAMLLVCIAAIRGDLELLEKLFGRNFNSDTSAGESVILKRDYIPSKDLTKEKLIKLRYIKYIFVCIQNNNFNPYSCDKFNSS